MQIKSFIFNPFMENTYVVFDETRQAAIIDCGCLYKAEEKKLQQFIDDNKLTVKYLLNTHLHLDHQFGNYFATQTFGVLPLAHKDDESGIAQLQMQAMMFGVGDKVKGQKLGSYLTDNEEIKVGNFTLKALHVPGHSQGHLCFYCEKEKVLFAGDVLFEGSIGRTDLPGGNFEQLIDGINKKLLVLPDDTVVYSGHGGKTTIGKEKLHNPFL
ncbi:MAG: MBL fold metallo-hydrolase [Prevotellaceae bacterium]|jgi:glyoxylase-like metal-dependent hydrolase (beta-lactamase superfamily II)|nr:MBL fold metallo-hydrolase [Prevotellaceae bacterium]